MAEGTEHISSESIDFHQATRVYACTAINSPFISESGRLVCLLGILEDSALELRSYQFPTNSKLKISRSKI